MLGTWSYFSVDHPSPAAAVKPEADADPADAVLLAFVTRSGIARWQTLLAETGADGTPL